jgi:hypothetical protein
LALSLEIAAVLQLPEHARALNGGAEPVDEALWGLAFVQDYICHITPSFIVGNNITDECGRCTGERIERVSVFEARALVLTI